MIRAAIEGDFFAARSDVERAILQLAQQRIEQGLAPPAELYRVELRGRVDWRNFPVWARPSDPEMFDGCCHEG
jgi:hypothetical protein